MASKGGKKAAGSNRAGSASGTPREAASVAASAGALDKRQKITIWPEWNDADINAEKWDAAHKGGKEDKKGKSPTVVSAAPAEKGPGQSHYFEDTDGKLEMPQSLRVDHWKRPQDFIMDKVGPAAFTAAIAITKEKKKADKKGNMTAKDSNQDFLRQESQNLGTTGGISAPMVVDTENMVNDFDLISNNEHLHESDLMRAIISQIHTMWELSINKSLDATPEMSADDSLHTWRPWEHIYSMCKVQKHHVPLFNPHGKYIVKLYWMGCWRKILVDDLLPFDENDQLLLPASLLMHELWPMLLTKALIKVASLDYSGGAAGSEFGDIHIIHCLTGWLPEAIPLHSPPAYRVSQVLEHYYEMARTKCAPIYRGNEPRHGHLHEVWALLNTLLPEWHLPEPEPEKAPEKLDEAKKDGMSSAAAESMKEEKPEATAAKETKPDNKEKGGGGKDKGKEKEKPDKGKEKDDKKDKKDKGTEKDKDKNKEKSITEEPVIPEKPEVVVFARFGSIAKYPNVKVSMLGEVADASERLRQNGLSHMYPHPVCITQTRSCPMEPPPPPEIVPAWKLIRPRKKREPPTSEPKPEPEPPKEIQCLEICSPFVNYKISSVPIPSDTSRPKSSLARGGTRSRPTTGNVDAIEETDENAPEPETVKAELHPPDVLTLEEPKEGSSYFTTALTFSGEKKDELSLSPPKADGKSAKSGSAKASKSASRKIDSRGGREEEHQGGPTKAKGKGADQKPSPPPTEGGAPAPAGGGAPGLESTVSLPAEMGEGEEGDAELMALQEDTQHEAPKPKKRWMDFDQFCICFRTLYIFHKPNTYLCNQRHSDLRNVSPSNTAAPSKGEKKPAAAAPGTAGSEVGPAPEDKSSYFLFVDNLKPTEIVVSFTVLPRWFDIPIIVEEKKGKGKDKDKDKESEKEPTLISSISMMEGSIGREHAPPPPVTPGTLVAEPYSWKSLVTGQPILRLKTTGTRAAVLSLPAGRHVLRFMMTSPLAHHVHMCSTVNFVFGDEETVMPQLTNESCRFRDNALQVINSLGKCITNFSDAEQLQLAMDQLIANHCPYIHNKLLSKQKHFQLFNEALYNMLRKALRDVATPEIALAWRSLVYDVTTPNILGLQLGSRPETSGSEVAHLETNKKSPAHQEPPTKPTGSASARGSAKPGNKKPGAEKEKGMEGKASEPEKAENIWATRYMEPTPEEHVAAVKVMKVWRGFWVRKVKQARTPGTEENIKAQENLLKSWAAIEPNAEEYGLFLFREMFKRDSEIMQFYPFYKDEWNKIAYSDYKGIFPDQPSNTWFVVFREVFFVKEETLAVPKLYVAIPTCMLRVIDNDTGEQLPSVFQKVAPYVYKRNKRGYTFVAEARTVEQPLMSAAWRMRLIGSISPLPAPRGPEVTSNFVTKDFRDYYLPNPTNVIFRYAVKVNEEQLTSLQVHTSKSDVYVHLSVLDGEAEVASATGKGHVVIPAFIFHKDLPPPGEEAAQQPTSDKPDTMKRSSSPNRAASKGKVKRVESAGKSPDGRASRGSQHSDQGVSEELDEKDSKPHKYIVQATVLRDSWPLSESSWNFVQQLKEQEKNELKDPVWESESRVQGVENTSELPVAMSSAVVRKASSIVAYKERPASPAAKEKSPPAGQKGKPKGKPDKGGGKEKVETKGSRPPSQQFDITKPHWSLRIVVDAAVAEDVEIRKDTERADEIRAMKRAWEDAEPGRAAKALQSRLKYLSTHTIKLQPDEEEKEEGKETSSDQHPSEPVEIAPPQTPISAPEQDGEVQLLLEPPPQPTPKEMLAPLDLTPFVRKTLESPRLLDETEMQKMLEERQREIAEYKEMRRQVEEWRAQDRAARNQAKIKQLDDAQALQLAVDLYRELVNVPREKFRQKHLEAERLRLEEMEALEALKAEQEGAKAQNKKSAKGKNSGKKGKK